MSNWHVFTTLFCSIVTVVAGVIAASMLLFTPEDLVTSQRFSTILAMPLFIVVGTVNIVLSYRLDLKLALAELKCDQ